MRDVKRGRATRRYAWVGATALALVALGLGALVSLASSAPAPTYVTRDPSLRNAPLSFYPSRGGAHPRAVVFFFGNDIGFWEPHRELAEFLAVHGYAVVGFDMRPLLASLPAEEPERDSVFARRIRTLIARSRHELAADSVPLVIAGHSLGAEVALWTAAYVHPHALEGVLAMAPGARSHLRVTWADLTNSGDPTGPGTFSVPRTAAVVPQPARIAVIRGDHDKYRYADPPILAAGGARTRRYVVPFASHSLKRILIAKLVVLEALHWMEQTPVTSAAASSSAAPSRTPATSSGGDTAGPAPPCSDSPSRPNPSAPASAPPRPRDRRAHA